MRRRPAVAAAVGTASAGSLGSPDVGRRPAATSSSGGGGRTHINCGCPRSEAQCGGYSGAVVAPGQPGRPGSATAVPRRPAGASGGGTRWRRRASSTSARTRATMQCYSGAARGGKGAAEDSKVQRRWPPRGRLRPPATAQGGGGAGYHSPPATQQGGKGGAGTRRWRLGTARRPRGVTGEGPKRLNTPPAKPRAEEKKARETSTQKEQKRKRERWLIEAPVGSTVDGGGGGQARGRRAGVLS